MGAGRTDASANGQAGGADGARHGGRGHDKQAAAAVVEARRRGGVDGEADEAHGGGEADGEEHELAAAAAAHEAGALRVVERLHGA